MESKPLFDLKSALGNRKSITVQISEIETIIGDDWLLELSAQADELGARIDPHHTDTSIVEVTRL